jgi:hypothetical protein
MNAWDVRQGHLCVRTDLDDVQNAPEAHDTPDEKGSDDMYRSGSPRPSAVTDTVMSSEMSLMSSAKYSYLRKEDRDADKYGVR